LLRIVEYHYLSLYFEGLWGLIAGPLLREEGVILSGGSSSSFKMLLWNLIGMFVIAVWSAALSTAIFGTLSKVSNQYYNFFNF